MGAGKSDNRFPNDELVEVVMRREIDDLIRLCHRQTIEIDRATFWAECERREMLDLGVMASFNRRIPALFGRLQYLLLLTLLGFTGSISLVLTTAHAEQLANSAHRSVISAVQALRR